LTNHERLEKVIEQMAMWAMDYRSPAHHDNDVIAMLGESPVTVGCLRWAFERYYDMPFTQYQESPKAWYECRCKDTREVELLAASEH
jgi:hypothetical protein